MNLGDIASVVGVPVAGVVGWIAWKAWRTSERVRVTNEKSWQTAEQTRKEQAEAEARRRHREMRPELDVSFADNPRRLVVKLTGPRDVERYDRIRLTVCDDRERTPGVAGGMTAEQIRETVWGPFRLRPGCDGADAEGRYAEQPGRDVTDSWAFSIDPTLPPADYGGGEVEWRRAYATLPMRLRVEIGLGDQSWTDRLEIPQPKRSAYDDDNGLTVV
jgi:hypothetical protein